MVEAIAGVSSKEGERKTQGQAAHQDVLISNLTATRYNRVHKRHYQTVLQY